MSSTAAFSSPAQAGWQQMQVQMAKRNADQAEQRANELRAQAADAQRTADRAQENARELSVNADQAETAAGRARQGAVLLEPTDNLGLSRLSTAAGATGDVQQTTQQPVVNTQGQVTGTTVNTTA
jgi:hypothetical protein